MTGDIAVTPVGEQKIYDVDISALGVLNLDPIVAPTLVDFRGNRFSGTVTSEEAFTIHEAAITALTESQTDTPPLLHTGSLPGTRTKSSPLKTLHPDCICSL